MITGRPSYVHHGPLFASRREGDPRGDLASECWGIRTHIAKQPEEKGQKKLQALVTVPLSLQSSASTQLASPAGRPEPPEIHTTLYAKAHVWWILSEPREFVATLMELWIDPDSLKAPCLNWHEAIPISTTLLHWADNAFRNQVLLRMQTSRNIASAHPAISSSPAAQPRWIVMTRPRLFEAQGAL